MKKEDTLTAPKNQRERGYERERELEWTMNEQIRIPQPTVHCLLKLLPALPGNTRNVFVHFFHLRQNHFIFRLAGFGFLIIKLHAFEIAAFATNGA